MLDANEHRFANMADSSQDGEKRDPAIRERDLREQDMMQADVFSDADTDK